MSEREAQVEAHTASAEALADRLRAVVEWQEADGKATASILASLEAMKTEVRAEFLPKANESITTTREAVALTLPLHVSQALEHSHATLSSAAAERSSQFSNFAQESRKSLLGPDGVCPSIASGCEALRARMSEIEQHRKSETAFAMERSEALGQDTATLKSAIQDWSEDVRGVVRNFAENAHVDDPSPFPSPLCQILVNDSVASTKSHQDLLEELHQGDVGSTEREMFQLVTNLLEKHEEAVMRGHLPFHDGTEEETCEGTEFEQDDEHSLQQSKLPPRLRKDSPSEEHPIDARGDIGVDISTS